MTGRSKPATLIAAAIILLSTGIAALMSRALFPALAFLTPSSIIVTIIGDIATTIVLMMTARVAWSTSRIALAAAYTWSGLFLTLMLLVQSYAPGSSPVIVAPPPAADWIFFLWHASAAVFGLSYGVLRRWVTGSPPFSRAASLAIAAGSVAAALGVMSFLAWHLGPFTTADMRTDSGGLAVLIGLAAAAAAVWSASRTGIERAFALTLLSMACAFYLETFVDADGSISAYFGSLVYASASVFVLGAAIADLARAFFRLGQTEEALAEHTQRLSAMWEIASDSSLDDYARYQAMLDAGARAIRPDHPFHGQIARLDGEDVVIAAISNTERLPADHTDLAAATFVGARIPLRDGLYPEHLTGGTRDWSDLALEPILSRRRRIRELRLRSAIGTAFRIGAQQYFLVFASRRPLARPFNRDDRVFIDVLGSFFAARLHQQQQLERIRAQAELDALTGLLNRTAFRGVAAQALREAGRANSTALLAIVDLDRFGAVNETYGHAAGDSLLASVADALRARLAPGDLIGRLGGDTFGVLLSHVPDRETGTERLNELTAALAEPFAITAGGEGIRLHASIGAALLGDDARTYEDLLARGEAALQFAKRGQRGIALYTGVLDSALEVRKTMRRALASGIGTGELVVHYQPAIALSDGRPAGAEALVRWQHPTLGLVGPDDFIPFAEEHGLIRDIGASVLRQVASDVAFLGARLGSSRIYVNLSLTQVEDLTFLSQLSEAIARQPDLVKRLGFEITESAAMRDAGQVLHVLGAIRELGMPVALDDFGTGYSSLAHLKRLPVDAIKIDRTFVAGLPHDPHDAALIETQLTIARQFGYETFAEGVEREEQLTWLRALGCRYAQGFFIARPMPLDEFTPWIVEGWREAVRAQRFSA
jgi:diguanylate cyclase (GGDEF)-like protein